MGVFLVNGEAQNAGIMEVPGWIWYPLCCTCFILIWNHYPESIKPAVRIALQILGWMILLVLAWIYRGGENGLGRFTTSWWGILGLIGWAYLVSALTLNLSGRKTSLLIIFWLICLGTNIAAHANLLPDNAILRTALSPFGEGAMPAFVSAGMLSSLLFIRFGNEAASHSFIKLLIFIAVILLVAGFLVRPLGGISKIKATPSWVLICTAITFAVFAIVYWIADLKKKQDWFAFIKPAGTNTLTCYLLPYFVYGLMNALHVSYPAAISHGVIGLIKSFIFALLIVTVAGWLGKRGVQVRL
jgi:predicted acyltransferase